GSSSVESALLSCFLLASNSRTILPPQPLLLVPGALQLDHEDGQDQPDSHREHASREAVRQPSTSAVVSVSCARQSSSVHIRKRLREFGAEVDRENHGS